MKLQNLSKTRVVIFRILGYTLTLQPSQTISVPSDITEEEMEPLVEAFKDLYLIKDQVTVDLTQYDLNHNNIIDQADNATAVDGKTVDDSETTDDNLWTAEKIKEEIEAEMEGWEDLTEIEGGTF